MVLTDRPTAIVQICYYTLFVIISHRINVIKHLSTYLLPSFHFFPEASEPSDERINMNIISTVLEIRAYELSVLMLSIACAIAILVSLRAKEDIIIFPSFTVVKLYYQWPNPSRKLISKCRRGGNTRAQERYKK